MRIRDPARVLRQSTARLAIFCVGALAAVTSCRGGDSRAPASRASPASTNAPALDRAARCAGVTFQPAEAELAAAREEFERARKATETSDCTVACNALASVRRNLDRMCRLDPLRECSRADARESASHVLAARCDQCADAVAICSTMQPDLPGLARRIAGKWLSCASRGQWGGGGYYGAEGLEVFAQGTELRFAYLHEVPGGGVVRSPKPDECGLVSLTVTSGCEYEVGLTLDVSSSTSAQVVTFGRDSETMRLREATTFDFARIN